MLCNSQSYARTASYSVMAIKPTTRAAVKCYSMNPQSSTIVSLSSLMARRRWYLYVSTEQAAPRRPEEPCRDSGSFNTSNRIAAQYSKDSNSNQQVRCALLAPWFMPMGKEKYVFTLPTHYCEFHDRDRNWTWGNGSIISHRYTQLFPLEIETSAWPRDRPP